MLIDRAVAAYQDFVWVTGWTGNRALMVEAEIFGCKKVSFAQRTAVSGTRSGLSGRACDRPSCADSGVIRAPAIRCQVPTRRRPTLWLRQEAADRVRSEGCGDGDIRGIATAGHQNTADARDIVARIKDIPLAAEIGFEPGCKIHRRI
jgi:hypothetical protein